MATSNDTRDVSDIKERLVCFSDSVACLCFTGMSGTVGAAVEDTIRFNPMPHNPASTVITLRGKFMDGAFEAVKRMTYTRMDDLKRLVIVVTTDFTFCHGSLS